MGGDNSRWQERGAFRYDAHRLYLNHGFKIIGHHFALNLKE